MSETRRPVVLVTGVGRRIGIGAGLAERLAATGWDVAFSYLTGYDARMPWGPDAEARAEIMGVLEGHGARVLAVEADLQDPAAPSELIAAVRDGLGPVRGLVMAHAESVDSSILDTSVESFDRHFAVNARAVWLLVKAFAEQFDAPYGTGRIVALTSDHSVHNLPYGASKGALDRIVLAAAHELKHLGLTANVVNPGPIDTGWISPELSEQLVAGTPLGRLGTPKDTADLVAFLCSPQGGWMNAQLLHSNGGSQ
ncbi:SDR family oxidoreductase [Kribbella sp. NPDC051770]|uniref:SDR family oxidoreductase n=1 Tax=Kribbella sp. NPDC051770 TaxID=3155413 RepID=UPI00342CA25C